MSSERATLERKTTQGGWLGRFDWLWFPGAIGIYFALQLWILPKMGVPT